MIARLLDWINRSSGFVGFCAVFLLFYVVFAGHMITNPAGDQWTHIAYAKTIMDTGAITSPHFLYQLLFIGLYQFLPWPIAIASFIQGTCYATMFVIIRQEALRLNPALKRASVTVLCVSVLVASHIFALTLLDFNFYYNYLVPVVYHNPTQQLTKLFAIWIWILFTTGFVGHSGPPSNSTIALIAVLLVLSAVAKPSFVIAFLPITGLLALRWLVTGSFSYFLQYITVVTPVVLVLVAQFFVSYTGEEDRGLIFSPFAVFSDPIQYLVTLPLSLAFPVSCVVFLWSHAIRDRGLLLSWLFLGLAIAYTLLLAEERDVYSGNFAWTAQVGAFILYVQSLFLVLRVSGESRRTIFAPLCILGVHFVFGVIFAAAGACVPVTHWR